MDIWGIISKRSILIPSAEIYGQYGGFYDYGPVGCAIKRRIEAAWRDFFIRREGFLEVDTSTILPEIVLQASGHVGHFADPLVECTKCKKRFRADYVIRDAIGKNMDGRPLEEMNRVIKEEGIKCPECGGTLGSASDFNLMFKTTIGAVEGNTGYMRPETAQGIFLAFPSLFRSFGQKLPLGIAQIGKSYRNEISPRQGLLRLREFTQMEIEYFFDPEDPTHARFGEVWDEKIRILTREAQLEGGDEKELTAAEWVKKGVLPNEIMAYFLVRETQFYTMLGIPYEMFRFRHMLPEETPHYSGGNFDLEVKTSYGWIETIGNAYRRDYDLSSHAKMSKEDLSVLVDEDGKRRRFIPHVVEPSFGVDRLFWCLLEASFRKKGEGKEWEWFAFSPLVAPFDAAVFPLMKKDGLAEKAREVARELRNSSLSINYDETGSIGKRYARADEIGIPYCITVDYETLEKNTVTLRFRDDAEQVRLPIEGLSENLRKFASQGITRKLK
ncbi:MAG: glycine--tRNA ligase [Candidatus Micrarchaeia archaeon]